ncbi:MAG: DUF4124 domain-containing protein [Gammaproteobacteria bacterium]|nr:DUF4124 domain-containing protein [Gammaproteobacteria bacterium]MBU0789894.1 DUF4124 domain-containing protein [Gammaproteobacteria bacterium]MBU1805302.1 DUF4124 domain-containing protein [Gammaproteobacteria bacterium]
MPSPVLGFCAGVLVDSQPHMELGALIMWIRIATVCALLLAANSPQAAQFRKCIDLEGKVNFTDQPCPDAKIVEDIARDPISLKREQQELDRNRLRASTDQYFKERAQKFRNRALGRGLRIGMSASEVRALPDWGWPEDSVDRKSAYGNSEQWIYGIDQENEYRKAHLFFDDGILTAIHL